MARPSNWQRHTGTHHSNRTYHCIVKRFAAAQLTMSCAAVFLYIYYFFFGIFVSLYATCIIT